MPPPGGNVRRWLTDRIVGQLRSIQAAQLHAQRVRILNRTLIRFFCKLHSSTTSTNPIV